MSITEKFEDHVAVTPEPRVQVAALCHRKGAKGREVLLVTSSRGRWILPKGWPIDGLSDGDAALQEAWEEAGVREGRVTPKPIAKFDGVKRFDSGEEIPARVRVYGVKVRQLVRKFPEYKRRERRWVSLAKAAKLLTEKGYVKALRAI
ncbi:NUDIX hydrolase [Loktanella salsilacus]|jgi:8-oxo-dGTP pyrophosphatase MutT (NUDIX family)|uniref:NUDIX hydrolase n=1 Tax=Loktanella salsilacus TaxID=195913 RepID=UPI001EBAA8FC|nr:NUDIX hydrolase [Loktanella salsilacus]MBU0779028.1 NUDIX hydrolase [Alphaproteobacteria bacterium]MBU0860804.1 NUDIX hydrolase [Alphaproteobacteria bacterium]MBU1834793.1 NUDIX hydrolase [Alphaproteobacteria bacterium]UTH43631.1 NUDIX hydrolase [Loktanella salsilacus]|tara:strand:- start:145 stop:588 length:444 start_codon:yes stop_codon:yes gene_type:complete